MLSIQQQNDQIAGRREAEALLELAAGTLAGKSPEFVAAFHERCRESLAGPEVSGQKSEARKPSPSGNSKKVEPMTGAECREFERREMPFGRHRGQLVEFVPLTYLDWYIGTPDDRGPNKFKQEATRYLANPTVARRLDELLNDEAAKSANAK